MGQFIAMAVAEKVASLRAVDYLRERAKRGSREVRSGSAASKEKRGKGGKKRAVSGRFWRGS
jgi:hypothetical protein